VRADHPGAAALHSGGGDQRAVPRGEGGHAAGPSDGGPRGAADGTAGDGGDADVRGLWICVCTQLPSPSFAPYTDPSSPHVGRGVSVFPIFFRSSRFFSPLPALVRSWLLEMLL